MCSMLGFAAMDAGVQPRELHLDGGEHDLSRLAQSFTAQVTQVGKNAQRLFMDNQWAEGYAFSMGLPLGIRMMVQDLRGRSPITLPIRHSPTALEFSFCRGQGISARTSQGQVLNFCDDQMRVGCVNETTLFEYRAQPGAVENAIHISLTVEALCELLGTERLPENVSTVLHSPGPLNFFEAKMDPAVLCLTDEVFELTSDLDGVPKVGRLVYLHAKAMELIALSVERSSDRDAERNTIPELDLRALRQAREILAGRLEHPPSTAELARMVGLGEKRLKAGFKQLYGSPLMSYHRRLKMERARELLVARAHNVTQVAALIGYANPSKFAAAYRREFGQSPSYALTGTD